MDHINFDFIVKYVRELVSDDIIKLYDFAMDKNIPVAKPETTKLLYILSLIKRPKRVLEIGTGVGCSAAILAKGLHKDGKILTLEKSEENYKDALKLINDNNLQDKIEVVNCDALDMLKELHQKQEKFDFIFLDGAKSQYLQSYPYLVDLLDDDGIWVSDNVLFRGMVATDDLLERRKKTLVKCLRKFLDKISHDDRLETVVIPIGDGVSLTIKKS